MNLIKQKANGGDGEVMKSHTVWTPVNTTLLLGADWFPPSKSLYFTFLCPAAFWFLPGSVSSGFGTRWTFHSHL